MIQKTLFFSFLFILIGCSSIETDPETIRKNNLKEIDDYLAKNKITAKRTASGLTYVITKAGSGAKPKLGQQVNVHYAGKLLNGKLFDTSIESVAKKNNTYNPNRKYVPFSFFLGARRVIAGWDEGIALLNKGAKATLYIPSYLGYGIRGTNSIPPNAVLIFDVELVDFK